jgi:opacity protein-like surface antigen
VLVLLAPAAWGQANSQGRFEITPYGGYRFGGTLNDTETGAEAELVDNSAFGLILNLRESANTQWELIASRQTTEADVSAFDALTPRVDVDVDTLQLGGTYQGEGDRVRPYLAATIGGTRLKAAVPDADSDTFWSFSIGGGLQMFPTSRLGLRLEARLWSTLIESNSKIFCSTGSNGGLCEIAIEGNALWQVETFAGVVFRF